MPYDRKGFLGKNGKGVPDSLERLLDTLSSPTPTAPNESSNEPASVNLSTDEVRILGPEQNPTGRAKIENEIRLRCAISRNAPQAVIIFDHTALQNLSAPISENSFEIPSEAKLRTYLDLGVVASILPNIQGIVIPDFSMWNAITHISGRSLIHNQDAKKLAGIQGFHAIHDLMVNAQECNIEGKKLYDGRYERVEVRKTPFEELSRLRDIAFKRHLANGQQELLGRKFGEDYLAEFTIHALADYKCDIILVTDNRRFQSSANRPVSATGQSIGVVSSLGFISALVNSPIGELTGLRKATFMQTTRLDLQNHRTQFLPTKSRDKRFLDEPIMDVPGVKEDGKESPTFAQVLSEIDVNRHTEHFESIDVLLARELGVEGHTLPERITRTEPPALQIILEPEPVIEIAAPVIDTVQEIVEEPTNPPATQEQITPSVELTAATSVPTKKVAKSAEPKIVAVNSYIPRAKKLALPADHEALILLETKLVILRRELGHLSRNGKLKLTTANTGLNPIQFYSFFAFSKGQVFPVSGEAQKNLKPVLISALRRSVKQTEAKIEQFGKLADQLVAVTNQLKALGVKTFDIGRINAEVLRRETAGEDILSIEVKLPDPEELETARAAKKRAAKQTESPISAGSANGKGKAQAKSSAQAWWQEEKPQREKEETPELNWVEKFGRLTLRDALVKFQATLNTPSQEDFLSYIGIRTFVTPAAYQSILDGSAKPSANLFAFLRNIIPVTIVTADNFTNLVLKTSKLAIEEVDAKDPNIETKVSNLRDKISKKLNGERTALYPTYHEFNQDEVAKPVESTITENFATGSSRARLIKRGVQPQVTDFQSRWTRGYTD